MKISLSTSCTAPRFKSIAPEEIVKYQNAGWCVVATVAVKIESDLEPKLQTIDLVLIEKVG